MCHKIVKWNIDFVTQEMTELFKILQSAGKADDTIGHTPRHRGDAFDSLAEMLAERVVERIRRETPPTGASS